MTSPSSGKPLHRSASRVLVNTGHGKGKTSAAMGVMIRGVARGWNVAVVQFIKSADRPTGEAKIGERLGVDWYTLGDGFTWRSQDLDRSAALALAGWEKARALIEEGNHELVILDEITYPLNWGWIPVEEAVETIRQRPGKVNVIITGRDVPSEIIDIADTVTEMCKVKHAHDHGIRAKKGIEY